MCYLNIIVGLKTTNRVFILLMWFSEQKLADGVLFYLRLTSWPCWRAGHWSCTIGCHWKTWCRRSSAHLQRSQNAPWPRRVQRSMSSIIETKGACSFSLFSTSLQHKSLDRTRGNLWFEHSLCAAGVIQTDALVHSIICGEIITHLVTVAASLVLRPTVSTAFCLRRFLQGGEKWLILV